MIQRIGRAIDMKAKTHEQFVSEIESANSNLKVIGLYKNARTKIKMQCRKCFYEWEALPTNLNIRMQKKFYRESFCRRGGDAE